MSDSPVTNADNAFEGRRLESPTGQAQSLDEHGWGGALLVGSRAYRTDPSGAASIMGLGSLSPLAGGALRAENRCHRRPRWSLGTKEGLRRADHEIRP
jgi:hypothetical protein